MGENPEIHVLDHKVRLIQPPDGFRTSLDSVFVAAACPAGAGDAILDMGSGVGGASFCLLWRVPGCNVTGVEIQPSHVELAIGNIALNAAQSRADFICADIRDFNPDKRFDHIICNPPYLEAGHYTPSPLADKATALGHRDADLTLKNWIDAAFRLVRSGGSLTMIHRADAADRIVQGLSRRFGAIEIIPLYPKAGQDARRVIVRAVKDRRSPARIRAGIVLHEAGGAYTTEADAILRTGDAIV